MNNHKLALLKKYTELQAADESLWFIPETASEGYLLQEFRYLTWLIEEATDEEIQIAIDNYYNPDFHG
jgi:hypothetical protein